MNYGTIKYIEQTRQINNLWWSLPLTAVSIANAAPAITHVAFNNYGDDGALYIVIAGIIISSGAVAGAANQVTFTDNFGQVLFSMDGGREANGYISIERIIQSQEVRVTATPAAAIASYSFTVVHYYLREVDKGTRF